MWCPKCKMEYRDGITVCADCGSPLVDGSAEDFDVVELCTLKDEKATDSLIKFLEYSKLDSAKKVENEDGTYTVTVPADVEKKAEKLFRGFLLGEAEENEVKLLRKKARELQRKFMEEDMKAAEASEDETDEEKEYDWDAEEADDNEEKYEESQEDYEEAENLGSLDDMDETPEEILYMGESNYVTKEEEYNDMKYSGITFVVFGILGEIYLLLCHMNIIPITYNPFVFVVIFLLFIGFIVLGIINGVKAAQIKILIPEEEERMENVMNWLMENMTPETVAQWTDDSVSEMENDLTVTSHIRRSLIHEYPDEKVDFLEYMVDRFYTEQYLEKEMTEETSDTETTETDESVENENEEIKENKEE